VETRPGVTDGGNDFLVAHCPAMREVLERASKIARLETPVLVDGEPGVGKGSVARHIHRLSRRSQGPMVCVACASLHEPELDERLFGRLGWSGWTGPSAGRPAGSPRESDSTGYWRDAGATPPPSLLEAAHQGTLLLGDVSQLPMWAQTKLLDILQQNEAQDRHNAAGAMPNVRPIATTSCNLEAAAAEGRFHPALFYFLNVACIHVPPLRERGDDIKPLAEHFLAQVGSVLGQSRDGAAWHFSEEAWDCLRHHPWPGNAPQLASVVARAVVLAEAGEIGRACVVEALGPVLDPVAGETIPVPLAGGLAEMELAIVKEVIRRCQGNKAAAARSLGLHRRTLYRLLTKKGHPIGLTE
jgi:DNA-binding NtrC family response regulator